MSSLLCIEILLLAHLFAYFYTTMQSLCHAITSEWLNFFGVKDDQSLILMNLTKMHQFLRLNDSQKLNFISFSINCLDSLCAQCRLKAAIEMQVTNDQASPQYDWSLRYVRFWNSFVVRTFDRVYTCNLLIFTHHKFNIIFVCTLN